MRSGAAADCDGYFHETAFYGSDDEFVAIVEPFLREGVEAGEPTLVTCAATNTALLKRVVGDLAGIVFVPGEARYQTPAATIAAYRSTFASLVADGATQIRVIGDVPHPGVGVPWHSWARYEAAVNHAFNDYPLWGLCPYDTRTTPEFVLDDVARSHPHLATADGHQHNHNFEDPIELLRRHQAPPDPLEHRQPDIRLVDPTPSDARAAVAFLVAHASLDRAAASDLELAVCEIATNASLHGEAPCVLSGWHAGDRVVVTIADRGRGVTDPLAGLMPTSVDAFGGRGLWIAHQICTDVSMRHTDDGFTVCLTAGELAA